MVALCTNITSRTWQQALCVVSTPYILYANFPPSWRSRVHFIIHQSTCEIISQTHPTAYSLAHPLIPCGVNTLSFNRARRQSFYPLNHPSTVTHTLIYCHQCPPIPIYPLPSTPLPPAPPPFNREPDLGRVWADLMASVVRLVKVESEEVGAPLCRQLEPLQDCVHPLCEGHATGRTGS